MLQTKVFIVLLLVGLVFSALFDDATTLRSPRKNSIVSDLHETVNKMYQKVVKEYNIAFK